MLPLFVSTTMSAFFCFFVLFLGEFGMKRATLWSFQRIITVVFVPFFFFFFTGSLLGATVRPSQTSKQERYGTTVPLQLVGQEWKPISQLRSQVKNDSW